MANSTSQAAQKYRALIFCVLLAIIAFICAVVATPSYSGALIQPDSPPSASPGTSDQPQGSMVALEAYPLTSPRLEPEGYHASIGEEVVVVARNFPAWLEKLADEGVIPIKKDASGVRRVFTPDEVKAYADQACLFLNEKPFPDIVTERADAAKIFQNSGIYVGKSKDDIFYLFNFALEKTTQNAGAWLDLLKGEGVWDRRTDVTIGFGNLGNQSVNRHMDSALNPTGQEAIGSPQELFSLRTAVTWNFGPEFLEC